MKTITIDTNIASKDLLDEIMITAKAQGFEVAAVSVTHRETESGPDFKIRLAPLGKVLETGVWDESRWDECKFASNETETDFERILQIISNNSFPPKNKRQGLSEGQMRQLRDAMIFRAHVREGRDIFLTNDKTAFVKDGRREKFEQVFGTKIMTSDEFLQFAKTGGAASEQKD